MELDKDLLARQEARTLCRQAEKAQRLLSEMPQQKLDAIVEAVAKAFSAAAAELAQLAVQETVLATWKTKRPKTDSLPKPWRPTSGT